MNQAANEFLQVAQSLQSGLLDDAVVTGVVATPVTEYPVIGDLISFIADNRDKSAVNPFDVIDAVNGEIAAEPMEDYLASKHLPSSGLKEVLKNPASFFFYLNDRKIIWEDPKKCFELGTFTHLAFLEPELFDLVKVEPKHNKATLEGCKELHQFYKKLNGNLTITDYGEGKTAMKLADIKALAEEEKAKCKYMMIQEEHDAIIKILKKNYSLYAGGIIPMIMKGAQIETSFYGTDQQTGIKVKVRPDAFNIAENIGVNAVISFKTTSCTSVEQFMSQAARLNYDLSEGMYLDVISEITGRKFDVTIMVMLQTVAPYQPAVIWFSPEDLQNGKYKYRYALDTASECLNTKKYPGFESLAEAGNFGIIQGKFPDWSHRLLKPVDLDN